MSVISRPSVWVDRRLRDRAASDGRESRGRAASSTRAWVWALAPPRPDSTRLTVAVETPARSATSAIVAVIGIAVLDPPGGGGSVARRRGFGWGGRSRPDR